MRQRRPFAWCAASISVRDSALVIPMGPHLITATAKVHSADENQVGANNGGGIYRWPEFDSRAGVSRLQPYPRLAHASYSQP